MNQLCISMKMAIKNGKPMACAIEQFGMEGDRWCADLLLGKSSTTWLFRNSDDAVLFRLTWG